MNGWANEWSQCMSQWVIDLSFFSISRKKKVQGIMSRVASFSNATPFLSFLFSLINSVVAYIKLKDFHKDDDDEEIK